MSSDETTAVAKAKKKWSWSQEAREAHSKRMKEFHAKRSETQERKATRNVTLDAHLQEKLNKIADDLVEELGFRPTLSQTVSYVIVRAEVV